MLKSTSAFDVSIQSRLLTAMLVVAIAPTEVVVRADAHIATRAVTMYRPEETIKVEQ